MRRTLPPVQRTRKARACARQARACTHGGAGARQDIARACGGGGEHKSGGAWPSSCPPTKTQQACARRRRGRKWAARSRQTRTPICASRRAHCGARARPCRAAPALAVQTWQLELAQNQDAMGGAAPRPTTRTMVLCTGTRGSRVRNPLRQRRPGRAARAAGRRKLSSLPILPLPDFPKGSRELGQPPYEISYIALRLCGHSLSAWRHG